MTPTWLQENLQVVAAGASAASGAAAIVAPDDFAQHWLGVPLPVLLAAFAGATCALSFLSRMGAMKSMVALSVSTVSAGYMVPLIAWGLNLPDKLSIGLAFMLALFGQTLIGSAFGALPEIMKQLLSALVERVRGRP